MRYVDDGDTITGAGLLSGIDMALPIIERTAEFAAATGDRPNRVAG